MRIRQGRMMALGRRFLGWASATNGPVETIDVAVQSGWVTAGTRAALLTRAANAT